MVSLRLTNLMLKKKKPAVIILQGLPASGKTTFSKSLCSSFPNSVIVSKDEIRREMWEEKFPNVPWKKKMDGWSPSENLVLEERDRRISEALNKGLNVIVDDTNLNPIHKERITSLVGNRGLVEVYSLNTPLQECIERDKKRPAEEQVGTSVIYATYKKYGGLNGQSNGKTQRDNDGHHSDRGRLGNNMSTLTRTERGMGRHSVQVASGTTPSRDIGGSEESLLGTAESIPSSIGQGKIENRGRILMGMPREEDRKHITFADAASKFLAWRKTIVGAEEENGWSRNSRGIWEFSWTAPVYSLDGRYVGKSRIYYADQNPAGRSREAMMVSTKRWQPHDAGWLWTIINGRRIWLGKATPEGSQTVREGVIAIEENGVKQFYIAL